MAKSLNRSIPLRNRRFGTSRKPMSIWNTGEVVGQTRPQALARERRFGLKNRSSVWGTWNASSHRWVGRRSVSDGHCGPNAAATHGREVYAGEFPARGGETLFGFRDA